jgi:hypothetical protein
MQEVRREGNVSTGMEMGTRLWVYKQPFRVSWSPEGTFKIDFWCLGDQPLSPIFQTKTGESKFFQNQSRKRYFLVSPHPLTLCQQSTKLTLKNHPNV